MSTPSARAHRLRVNRLLEYADQTGPTKKRPYAGVEHFWLVGQTNDHVAPLTARRVFRATVAVMTAQPELNGLASRDSVELDEPPHSLIFDMGRVTIIDDVGLLEYTPELAAAFHPLRYMIHVPTMHEYAQTARVDNFVPPIFGRALLKGLERISSHMLDQIEKSPS